MEHHLLYDRNGRLILVSSDEEDVTEEQTEYPGSLICKCDCDNPNWHLVQSEFLEDTDQC